MDEATDRVMDNFNSKQQAKMPTKKGKNARFTKAEIAKHNDALEEKLLRARVPQGGPVHYVALANFLIRKNRISDAEAVLREAISLSPDDPNLALELARFYMRQKQIEKSEQTFMAVTREWFPEYAPGFVQRAHFELNYLKDLNKANSTFHEVMEVVGDSDALVFNDYALFLRKHLGLVDEAEVYYLKGLEINPTCPNIANNYALLYVDT